MSSLVAREDLNHMDPVYRDGVMAALSPEFKVNAYRNHHPASSKIAEALEYIFGEVDLDRIMNTADVGISVWQAWDAAEKYDNLLNALRNDTEFMKLANGDEKWLNDVLDELEYRAASSLSSIGEELIKKSIELAGDQLTEKVCKEVVEQWIKKAGVEVVTPCVSLASGIWTGIEVGNMIGNSANTVGAIPMVAETIDMYQDSKAELLRVMDEYVMNPSQTLYDDLKMKAELHNILKGAAIVSMYDIYIAEQDSIQVKFTNWIAYEAELITTFWKTIVTQNWSEYEAVKDKREAKIADLNEAMLGELQQMNAMIEELFPME